MTETQQVMVELARDLVRNGQLVEFLAEVVVVLAEEETVRYEAVRTQHDDASYDAWVLAGRDYGNLAVALELMRKAREGK